MKISAADYSLKQQVKQPTKGMGISKVDDLVRSE